MITAENLSKRYGEVHALNELNLHVPAAEIYCLLGQNGAGKTTTINCFLGFVRPDTGRALVNGIDVQTNPVGVKKFLAYLPEVVVLYPQLSALENLDYFSRLAGFTYPAGELLAFLEAVGLQGEVSRRRIATYSKGMRQKVGIAIALAKQAKALFLDEPTSGLDPKAANDFSELLLDLRQEGMAILMATHDIFRAKDVANRIGIMRDGQLANELANSGDLLAKDIEELYFQTI